MTELEQFTLESELYESILDIGASEIEYGLESYIQYSKCLEREKMLMESSRDFQFEEFVLEAADEKTVWQKIVSFLKSIFVTYSPEHLCRMIDKMPDDKWVAFRDGGWFETEVRTLAPMFTIISITESIYEVLRLDGKSETDGNKSGYWVDDKCIEVVNKILAACVEIVNGYKENYADEIGNLNKNAPNMSALSYASSLETIIINYLKPLQSAVDTLSYPQEYKDLAKSIIDTTAAPKLIAKMNIRAIRSKDDFKKYVMSQFAIPMRKAHKNKNYAECLAKINKAHNTENPNGKQVSETVDTSAIKSTIIMINKINKFVGKRFREILTDVRFLSANDLEKGPNNNIGDNVRTVEKMMAGSSDSSDNVNSTTNSGTPNGAN